MNWEKIKLGIEVLISPSLWLRIQKTNPHFDAWLWDALERGALIEIATKHTCMIEGVRIWIANAPYADASSGEYEEYGASRITALRLRKKLAPMIYLAKLKKY